MYGASAGDVPFALARSETAHVVLWVKTVFEQTVIEFCMTAARAGKSHPAAASA